VGTSDWVKLTTDWKTLFFTSLSPQQLQNDPPPGLQTDPGSSTSTPSTPTDSSTPSTTPSTLSTPSDTNPVLTIANSSLSVPEGGGTVDLGTMVTTAATAKDPVTGAITSSAPQTITVKDPAPATDTTSPQTATVADDPPTTGTSTGSLAGQGLAPGQVPVSSAATTSAPQPVSVADHSALFNQIRDLVAGGVATSAPQQPITVSDHPSATGTTTASLVGQSFVLLNQYLAGHTGRVDLGQIVAAVSNGASWGQDSFLTKPQH
jgi:hypothetical protein